VKRDLLADLEAGRLDPARFGHADHVQVAWALLGPQQAGFGPAYQRLRAGLSDLATRAGQPERYNETITLAFLSLVHETLSERPEAAASFDAFREAAPELFDPARVAGLYPPGVLSSPPARAGLILPRASAA
jgi:hypothetical protein